MVNFPGFSFFHGTGWGRTLVDAYDFSPQCIVRGAPSAPTAYLPIMEVSSWLTGRRGISLPYTDSCDALCSDDHSFRELCTKLDVHARRCGWKSWELRGNHAHHGHAPAAATFWGHNLALGSSPEEVFTRLQGSTRTAVRKAISHGTEIEFSTSLPAVREFYRLLCQTRQRHGLPPQPFHFFEHLQRHVLTNGQGWVVLAKHGGHTVAGAVFLHIGKTAVYKFAASDGKFRDLQANTLVLWRAVEWYARGGFERMDFGRTSLANEGLRRFKRAWGAVENAINYIKYDLRTNRFVSVKDQSSGWHTHLFRLLPAPIASLAGSVAYRHMA